jgi:putative transposase
MPSNEDRLSKWQGLLDVQRRSGLSVKDWCASEGISTQTFYYWHKRLRDLSSVGQPMDAPTWLAAALDESELPSSALTLRVGRVSVDVPSGFDAALLTSVLAVLEARC